MTSKTTITIVRDGARTAVRAVREERGAEEPCDVEATAAEIHKTLRQDFRESISVEVMVDALRAYDQHRARFDVATPLVLIDAAHVDRVLLPHLLAMLADGIDNEPIEADRARTDDA